MQNFAQAAETTLKFLKARTGFDLWMFTRTENEHWIVLHHVDSSYGIVPGVTLQWADSFCSRMVQALGPRISPETAKVPAYATAPIGAALPIGAYAGVPILHEGGGLFGTLCAIHPEPLNASIKAEQPLVELLASLLGTLLATEMRADLLVQKAELTELSAEVHPVSGLLNAKAWEKLIPMYEERCRNYGSPTWMISIKLDSLSNAAMKDLADQLMAQFPSFVVCQLEEFEFSAMGYGATHADADAFAQMVSAFDPRIRIGCSLRHSPETLVETHSKARALAAGKPLQWAA